MCGVRSKWVVLVSVENDDVSEAQPALVVPSDKLVVDGGERYSSAQSEDAVLPLVGL